MELLFSQSFMRPPKKKKLKWEIFSQESENEYLSKGHENPSDK